MTEAPKQAKQELLTFPCDFTIKVFGAGTEEFENTVLMIIHKYIANVSDRAIQSRTSENGTYRALSITVHVESRQQLDDIYQELTSSPAVLMAL